MRLEYKKIFQQAYSLTKTHKFLWLFGLFLFGGNMLNLAYNWQGGSNSSSNDSASNSTVVWLQAHPPAAFWILIAVVAVAVLFVYLYFYSKIASILSIKALIEKQEISLAKALSGARGFFRRVISVSIITNLIWFALGVAVASPILYLFSAGRIGQAVILALLGAAIIIPTSVVMIYIGIFAPIFIVGFNLKTIDSIRGSFDLISKYWPRLILFTLLLLMIVLASLIISSLISIVPFVLLAILAYHKMTGVTSIVVQTALVAIGSIIFLALQSAIVIFQQASWVLAFLQLVRPEKVEEEETLVAEEMVP